MAARARATPGTRGGKPKAPAGENEELLDRLVHDLRNPLGVIAYYSEVVSDAAESERLEMCERLRINAQRALHILEEFSLLGELRQGAGRPLFEPCDVAALVCQLSGELESLERRPGQIQARVDVGGTVRLARAHLTCALRGLLREALRGAARDDVVELTACQHGRRVVFVLSSALPATAGRGGRSRTPTRGLEFELAAGVAALCRGRCTAEMRAGRSVITLTLPQADSVPPPSAS